MATTRKRPGPRTPFGPKHPPTKSYALTQRAKVICRHAARRARQNESNVVELLLRRHGHEVTAASFAEYEAAQEAKR